MTKFKIPKKLGECADILYTTRQQRLEIEKQADELKKRETAIKDHLLEKLGAEQAAEGVVGSLATVRVLPEVVAVATDWEAIGEFIVKNKAVDLVQRRLSNEAVKARWEAGIVVPGVDKLVTKKISITKR